jgi:hypothetical protein
LDVCEPPTSIWRYTRRLPATYLDQFHRRCLSSRAIVGPDMCCLEGKCIPRDPLRTTSAARRWTIGAGAFCASTAMSLSQRDVDVIVIERRQHVGDDASQPWGHELRLVRATAGFGSRVRRSSNERPRLVNVATFLQPAKALQASPEGRRQVRVARPQARCVDRVGIDPHDR